ncbi:hypothetical protein F3087_19730 [Nocardia colli]|uniref:Uncharacterized protein n=1 Tax=Nocardia colli TaxID=2545717 RepID=A0A5N0ECJ4_9NOCA|nr:hypothetical protein [Nocardia colli]KAA8887138.1 hypothetical protein F3087_19730 [Nocardia colli]
MFEPDLSRRRRPWRRAGVSLVATGAVLVAGTVVLLTDPFDAPAQAGPYIPCEQWQQMHPGWPCVDVPDPPTPPPGPPTTPPALPTPALPGQPSAGTGAGSQAGALTPPPVGPGNGTPIVPVPGAEPNGSMGPTAGAGPSPALPTEQARGTTPAPSTSPVSPPEPAGVPQGPVDISSPAYRMAGLFGCDWTDLWCGLNKGWDTLKKSGECLLSLGIILAPFTKFRTVYKLLTDLATKFPKFEKPIKGLLTQLEKIFRNEKGKDLVDKISKTIFKFLVDNKALRTIILEAFGILQAYNSCKGALEGWLGQELPDPLGSGDGDGGEGDGGDAGDGNGSNEGSATGAGQNAPSSPPPNTTMAPPPPQPTQQPQPPPTTRPSPPPVTVPPPTTTPNPPPTGCGANPACLA